VDSQEVAGSGGLSFFSEVSDLSEIGLINTPKAVKQPR
jgi:hypothetical protein